MFKLPCLWVVMSNYPFEGMVMGSTYPWAVRGLTGILVIMSNFVEIVLVQLPYKACKVAMLEVFGQDGLSEPFILRPLVSVPASRMLYNLVRLTSSTTKLSPSSPHLTTCEYVGSSSILNKS